jgi:metallophosphoesterase superfamily enzyme
MPMRHKVYNRILAQVIDDVRLNPDTYTIKDLTKKYGLTHSTIGSGIHRWKTEYNLRIIPEKGGVKTGPSPHIRLLNRVERKRNTKNVLVIGDLHEPFSLDGYVDFCRSVYDKYNCTHVIFIGDIIDQHATSFHTPDVDGYSAGHELERAIQRIERWTEAFPVADVTSGNHDRLVSRKAAVGAISGHWIRSYAEVLNTPGWEFREEFIYDNVKYVHGEQGTARQRARKDLISTVQGHRHSEAYIEHIVGESFHIFGMQVGCGVDRRAYAFSYAKAGNKPAISVGVVLDHGRLPIIEMAQLSGGIITTT